MALAGGTMLGLGRTVKSGKTVSYEFLQIRANAEGKLVYIAAPSGQKEATFVALSVAQGAVTFENLQHDFPQRIIYTALPEGRLAARIEAQRNLARYRLPVEARAVRNSRWQTRIDNREMKNFQSSLTLLISASALNAFAGGNALWQAEQSCIKYPTPSARTECEKKLKTDQAAFEKERQKKKADAKSVDEATGDTKKKNDLCFKRESTGETVCPN